MSNYQKLVGGVPTGTQVQGSDLGSGAATSAQFLAANGSAGAAFRSIVSGDLPSLSGTYLSLSAGGTVAGATTFSASGTALTVSNNAVVGGVLAIGGSTSTGIALNISNSALATTNQIGVVSQITSTSSATSSVIGFNSLLTTAASTAVISVYNYKASGVTVGSSGSITRLIDFFSNAASGHSATDNAAFADNSSFTGNWFLNQSGSDASTLGGALTVGGVLTAASTTDASNSTTGGTVVSGGLAVAKQVAVGTYLSTGKNLSVGSYSNTPTVGIYNQPTLSANANQYGYLNAVTFSAQSAANFYDIQLGGSTLPSTLAGNPVWTGLKVGSTTVPASQTLGDAFGIQIYDVSLGASATVGYDTGLFINTISNGTSQNIELLVGGTNNTPGGTYSYYQGNTKANYFGGNVTTNQAIATTGYDTSTATSGTITASANKPGLIINSAGGTTLTIKLPSSPIDGQQYWVTSQGNFTTVTWQDSGGTAGNVIGGQASIGGTARGQRFVYSSSATKWFSIG